jgi:putative glutamine amidotransferase
MTTTMKRPLLVSCSAEDRAKPYLEALALVGFAPEEIRVVTPGRVRPEDAAALGQDAAGLLLCGGPDLEPHHYGEEPHPHANLSTMPERDVVEIGLLEGARAAKTPTFGVCRGLQMTNAFLGGTLWQDLKLQWPNAMLHDLSFPRDALIHEVKVVAPESELGQLLAKEPSLVNSRHHQAIKDLAPGLQAVAVAPDGIVEAIAGSDPSWWLWGVQWHPENLVSLGSQRALLERFRDEVRAHEATREQAATTSPTRAVDHEPALR